MADRARHVVLLLALLPGCLAPKFVRPDAPVAEAWPTASTDRAVPAPVDAVAPVDLGWRDFLLDPGLQRLVATALEQNRDLRIAALNVERARASYRIRLADQLPDVNLEASATSSKQVFGPGLGAQGTVFRAGVSMPSFELDLFGRLRYQSLSSFRSYLAEQEGARSTRISLVAEVARAWLAERSFAEQQAIAERSVAAREGALALTRQRFEAGLASELDVQQGASLVAAARASVAALARERAQARDALTLLVGAPIGPSPEATPLADVGIVLEVPDGLPSELLLQRPDVRAAEQRIRAANFDIGSARAAFFPRISLTASGGTASSSLSGLFGAGAGVWSFVPALVQPLLQIPQSIAQLKVAKVDRDIAVAEYEKAIQAAFRDVADALVAKAPLDEQVAWLQQQRAAEARRLELAEQRYAAGVSSFLEVLDAQRSLLEAERSLVQARQLRLSNAVDLYAALGGGLRERTGDAPASPGVQAKGAGG